MLGRIVEMVKWVTVSLGKSGNISCIAGTICFSAYDTYVGGEI